MKIYPKVSIMIPTYNQENFIEEAIQSAVSQDYPNLEIIVSDDGSTDNTSEKIRKYLSDERIKYFKNEKNLGREGNYYNTLYNLTTGEWIVNLDGDDYFTDKHFITSAMKIILENANIICYLSNKYLPKGLKKFKDNEFEPYTFLFNGKEFFLNWFKIGVFAHAGTIYKRELILDNKCYTFKGLMCDVHGIIRYLPLGNIVLQKKESYVWRKHEKNATNSVKYPLNLYKEQIKCHEEIIKDMKDGLLTLKEKESWLKDGKKNALRNLYINNLIRKFNVKNIINFLMISNYSISDIKIFLKSFLNGIIYKYS